VAKPHKFFGQVGSDPLGAAIQTRRNALDERSDLCGFYNDLYFLPSITNVFNVTTLQFHQTNFNNTISHER